MAYTKIAYEPHPVSPERKKELNGKGFKIIDARFKPADAKPAESEKIDLGTDSGEGLSDDQLRAAIEAATGQKPHHLLGRAKLVEQFNALNAEAAEEAGE